MIPSPQLEKIRKAFTEGKLKVQSISPVGIPVWKRVLAVQRAEVGPESILEITTEKGPMVLTGGHRVFLDPVQKTESENLNPDSTVQSIIDDVATQGKVIATRKLHDRKYMFDLTAEDWHNFVLQRSGVVVSNSPDRNYHFRPPSSQDALSKQTRVFGYIWEDAEMLESLERGLDVVNLYPPQTSHTIAGLPRNWTTITLTAAAVHALTALSINWVSEEFSVGGEEELDLRLPDGTELCLTFEDLYDIVGGPQTFVDLLIGGMKQALVIEG